MIGKRFGRWTVLDYDSILRGGPAYYICKCDCGTVRSVNGHMLRQGKSRSCGCLHGNGRGHIDKRTYIYVKVTQDKYEFPLDMDMDAEALAKRHGLDAETMLGLCNRRQTGWRKVVYENEEGEL